MQRDPPKLLLRAPAASDLQALYELHADPAANRFNPAGPMRSLDAAAELLDVLVAHWRQHGFGYWMAADAGRPDHVLGIGGLVEKSVPGRRGLNLYYRLRPEAWGRGLATALALRAITLATDTLHRRHEVFARVRPDNAPSMRVLERAGLVCIGEVQDVDAALPPSRLYVVER